MNDKTIKWYYGISEDEFETALFDHVKKGADFAKAEHAREMQEKDNFYLKFKQSELEIEKLRAENQLLEEQVRMLLFDETDYVKGLKKLLKTAVPWVEYVQNNMPNTSEYTTRQWQEDVKGVLE